MSEILTSKIEEVDLLLEKCEFDQVVSILKDLVNKYPDEGIIPYYFGRLAMIGKDEALALKYFTVAQKKEYNSIDLYLSMAFINNSFGALNDAEKCFDEAVKLASTPEAKWATLSAFAAFYIEHAMYLKAEKISKVLINEQPNAYQGYHIHIMSESLRGHIEEVISYIDKVPTKFKNHPQYLMDVIEIYKLQDKSAELAKLFEMDDRFMKFIPQIVLREKIVALPSTEETAEEKEALIAKLAKEYHDSDAIVSYMIIQFGKRNFKVSSQLANIVLENEMANQGMKYYLALYFQIFNLYFLADKKPSKKLREWIEASGNWCIDFAEKFDVAEIGGTVRDSIQELFDEINALED